MRGSLSNLRSIAAMAIWAASLAGCATVASPKAQPVNEQKKPEGLAAHSQPAPSGIAATGEQRKKKVADEFDHERDRAQYQAAVSRWRQGDAAGARETLAPLLARNPDHHEAQLLAAQLELADDKPKSSLERARRVLVARPDDAQAHFQAALALDTLGSAADALPHYEQAAQLAPHDEVIQASYQSALTAAVPPPLGTGVNVSDAAPAEPGRQPQAAVDAAVAALRQNRIPAAIQIATTSLKQSPDNAALWRTLGMAHFQNGDLAAAESALTRAIALDRSSALACYLMGSTLARAGRSEEAADYFARAAHIDARYANAGRQSAG